MKFAVYPGTVTTYDDQVVTMTYNDLIAAYNVDPAKCVLGSTVAQRDLMRYILLKPRRDNEYPDMREPTELGAEQKWGPDFDGSKKWTQETNYDNLYADQNAEQKP